MSPRTVLLAGLLALAGCLPEAGPGPGERRVEGRGMAMLAAAVPAAGQSPTIFFSRKGAPVPPDEVVYGPPARDLFVSRPGEPTDQLVMADFSWGCCGPRFDARGRLYAAKGNQYRQGGAGHTLIVDPSNGAPIDLGATSAASRDLMSPGGQQYAYTRADGIVAVRTTDDVERLLPRQLHTFEFIDEILYAKDERELWRVRPDGSPPERLAGDATAKTSYVPITAAGRAPAFVMLPADVMCPRSAARLLLTDPVVTQEPLGLVDTGTRGVIVEGQTVMLRELSTTTAEVAFNVITLQPRSMRRIVIPTGPVTVPPPPPPGQRRPPGAAPEYPPSCGPVSYPLDLHSRPGSDEIWALRAGMLTIVHGDGRVEQLAGDFQYFEPMYRLAGEWLDFDYGGLMWRGTRRAPPFSSDGRLWAYRDNLGRLRVARTSEPAGPNLVALPGSQASVVGEVNEGKTLLVWSGGERKDVHLFDLDPPGRRRTLPDVRQLLVGQRRLLGRTQAVVSDRFAPGPLELIDLPSGEVHRLASHVTEFLALPSCPGCDPTGPAAALVYVANARVPWEHDGLWTSTLPDMP